MYSNEVVKLLLSTPAAAAAFSQCEFYAKLIEMVPDENFALTLMSEVVFFSRDMKRTISALDLCSLK